MDLLMTLFSWSSFLLAIFLVLLIKSVVTSVAFSKRRRLPPGPPSLPLFGNMFILRTRPHEVVTSLVATYGPIMSLQLGSVLTIVISSSTLAKRALIHQADMFSHHFIIDAVYAHGHDRLSVGWLSTSSPQWRPLRRLYGLLFSGTKLDSSVDGRHLALVNLVDRVTECSSCGLVVDIGQVALTAFFEIMLNTVFSRDMSLAGHNPREIEELMLAILQEIGEPNLADCFPILHLVDPQGIRRRLTLLCKKLFKVFDDIIESRLRRREEMQASAIARSAEDALDLILDAMEDQKAGITITITREIVLHMLLDIIGSGMDSSSKAVEWAMAEVLSHPQILEKAQQELHTSVGRGKLIKDSHICKLPYIQALLKETFRLHPPVPFLPPRRTQNDVQFHGYTIPKGSRLLVNLWAIGRDPDDWANPDSFAPERFLGSNMDVKRQRFEPIPFSAGRRICPGMPLASRTVLTMVASLINCFDWKLEDEGDVDMLAEFRITLKKARPLRAVPIDRVSLNYSA